MIAQGISGGTVKHRMTSRPDRSTRNRNTRQGRIAAVQLQGSNATSITSANALIDRRGGQWDNSGSSIGDQGSRTDGGTSNHLVKSRTSQGDLKQGYPNVTEHSKRMGQTVAPINTARIPVPTC
jgi:hypothetical protein